MTSAETARDKLQIMSLTANSALSEYIRLHDRLLEKQSSFWNTIKNMCGFHIPFDRLLAEVVECEKTWKFLTEEVFALDTGYRSYLGATEQGFLDALTDYVRAVHTAVVRLKERQQLLLEVSRGDSGEGHSHADFRASHQRYEEAVRAYTEIGKRLNDLYAEVFS